MLFLSTPSPPGFWRKLNKADRLALVLAALLIALRILSATGKTSVLIGLLSYVCFFVLVGYTFLKVVSWVRKNKLWSIRNRLIAAYLFIAVVPLFLLGGLAALSGVLIYRQLGAYFIYRDVQGKLERLGEIARVAAATSSAEPDANQPAIRSILAGAAEEFPGIRLGLPEAKSVLSLDGVTKGRFLGLVQRNDEVWLLAVTEVLRAQGKHVIGLAVPFDEKLLQGVVPELGPVQASITRPALPEDPPERVTTLGDAPFVTLRQLSSRNPLPPRSSSFVDKEVTGLSKLETISLTAKGTQAVRNVLFVSVSTRSSVLNKWLFSLPGDVGSIFARGLLFVGVLFLFLEVAALVTGISLSRSITSSVDDLYNATRKVQEGDFSYRVRVARNDQLGALGESFNAMTGSIMDLVEEQRQRQRLENEISIAQEVQSQLFPQEIPQIPGVELYANCRAARMVSGDYFDFIQLGPQRVAMTLADISGKGISAALLMASLQAALRSQLLLDAGQLTNTADLVARLNRHLFLNTSPDRYATLFFAIYDTASHTLTYTNAGHLPPFLVSGTSLRKLEEGGMVVGLFDEFTYEQGKIQVEPGSLLIAFSDGLTEPENAYGEQFGQKRLAEEVLRHRAMSLQHLTEQLFVAAEEWGGTPGQADDMTVLVARLS